MPGASGELDQGGDALPPPPQDLLEVLAKKGLRTCSTSRLSHSVQRGLRFSCSSMDWTVSNDALQSRQRYWYVGIAFLLA
jgi:hypothetical protein